MAAQQQPPVQYACNVAIPARLWHVVVALVLCVGFLLVDVQQIFHTLGFFEEQKTNSDSSNGNQSASDLLTRMELFLEERVQMEKRQMVDYGNYFQNLFFDANASNGINNTTNASTLRKIRGKLSFFNPENPTGLVGWNSLKDRLKQKVLTAQLNDQQRSNKKTKDPNNNSTASELVKFVFAIAGHSSSAGHGNFERDSYGAVMDRVVAPLFSALGVQLETRSYGMSGKPSAPEMALCQEAILGTDVDVVLWDYALTDNGKVFQLPYWIARAISRKSPPIVLVHHSVGDRYKPVIAELYANHPHLPLMVGNATVVGQVEAAVPDSLQVDGNVSPLPPLLQFLRCGQSLERNVFCKDYKFNRQICPDRYWMMDWHPGYKRLALWGHLLALFLADAMDEAIYELQNEMKATMNRGSESSVLQLLLQQLDRKWHEQNRNMVKDSASSQPLLNFKGIPLDQQLNLEGNNRKVKTKDVILWFYHSRNICRTMRLPSQQRYKGISTGYPFPSIYFKNHHNSSSVAVAPEEGLEHEVIVATFGSTTARRQDVDSNDALPLELGYDALARRSQRSCTSDITNRDFSDYMYATDQWRYAVLPSQAEREEYLAIDNTAGGNDGGHQEQRFHQLRGIILACPLQCKRQTKACYGDEIGKEHWNDYLQWHVNDVSKGISMIPFLGGECAVLRHSQPRTMGSNVIFPPRKDGTFEIRVRIKPHQEPEGPKILQLSSIVLI
ncbi:expressed unknown protein [Seminavis robusta]|uniref:Uncharacterized protein n=1 Tax=Seminavis robusta TaxID=568900 RepID=A0A9N8EQN8_9STRA|nr:expressed unknown protein [Seminavis robusta]|eukprot:Sro1425_g271510.1 n/a (727) ;mRNA; r:3751-5931